MAFSAGGVVLVSFPFRDKAGARPAVVVSAQAYNQLGDLVVAAVTSHPPRGGLDYALADWSAANLKLPSTVRMLLATVAETRILLSVGRLSDRDWAEVQDRVRQVFAWP
jgi:mRNA-degrading endonuclease toxin of MazEF toxin-antitoxin module